METDEKKKVLERYPDAWISKITSYTMDDYWIVLNGLWSDSEIIGEGKTEQEAWKDAWDNISY